MSERTSYPPGAFSWAELATSDAAGAKAFYAELFGWDYDDNETGGGPVYSMALLRGKPVAALFASEQPPHWNCYVTVESADDSAQRASAAGGTVVAEPFDVMEVGRMAVVADPVGAALCLWEPRLQIGAAIVNESGAMTWNDLVTSDPDAAERFYGELFGWTFEALPDAGGYRIIRNGERSNGGVMPMPDAPPSWVPYFGHDDVDALAGRIGELGGSVFNGPMATGPGRIAVLGDPQGAAFCVYTGPYDD
jgi:uncharacterized protein